MRPIAEREKIPNMHFIKKIDREYLCRGKKRLDNNWLRQHSKKNCVKADPIKH